jgi:Zn-dependent peptidase ImmA (M78 family)
MQLNLYELHEGINPSQNLITQQNFNLSSVNDTASTLRNLLQISIHDQKNINSYEQIFNLFRDAFFNLGIYVFKKAFKNDQISSFSLFDSIFPIICVNNSLSLPRQIFTIFHEIYHLLNNTSGIDFLDDTDLLVESLNPIERNCNEFAAVFLVPDDDFLSLLNNSEINDDCISTFAKIYCVSREVILRKLLHNTLISSEYFNSKRKDFYKDNFSKQKSTSSKSNSNSAGPYYNAKISHIGKHYIELAFSSFYSQKITLTQLAEYMDMKIPSLKNLAFMLNWDNI